MSTPSHKGLFKLMKYVMYLKFIALSVILPLIQICLHLVTKDYLNYHVLEIYSIECDSAIQKPLFERHYQL